MSATQGFSTRAFSTSKRKTFGTRTTRMRRTPFRFLTEESMRTASVPSVYEKKVLSSLFEKIIASQREPLAQLQLPNMHFSSFRGKDTLCLHPQNLGLAWFWQVK